MEHCTRVMERGIRKTRHLSAAALSLVFVLSAGCSAPIRRKGVTESPPPPSARPPGHPAPPANKLSPAAADMLKWPNWTQHITIPKHLVAPKGCETVGCVYSHITRALKRAEFSLYSVYRLSQGGFAVVTRMERIDDRGRPWRKDKGRWHLGVPPCPSGWGAGRCVASRIPAWYRSFVITFSSKDFEANGENPTAEQIIALAKWGASHVDREMPADRPTPANARCVFYIYEFQRKSRSDPMVFTPLSAISPKAHIIGAGFWTDRDLRRDREVNE